MHIPFIPGRHAIILGGHHLYLEGMYYYTQRECMFGVAILFIHTLYIPRRHALCCLYYTCIILFVYTWRALRRMESTPKLYAVSLLKTKNPKTQVSPTNGRRISSAFICDLIITDNRSDEVADYHAREETAQHIGA